jgi:hypothetical protein
LKNDLRRAVGAYLAVLFALIPTAFLLANAGAAEAIAVRIVSSADSVDAALPFTLTAWTSSVVPVASYNWTDSLGGSADTLTWDLDVDVPGNLTVTLAVTDTAGDHGTATLTVPVRPALEVIASSPMGQVDTGLPAPIFINVTGGIPPVAVNWAPVNGGPGGNATWPVDGNFSETIQFSQTGPGWILVRAVDALGQSTSSEDRIAEIVSGGSLLLSTNGSVGEAGWPLGLAVDVSQGAPPFRWSLASSLPLSSSVGSVGTFPSDGMYRWNVTFAFPGVSFVNLTAVDAPGALFTVSTAVVVELPLSIQIFAPEGEPATPFEVQANITGGLPPYTYQFRLSDGEVDNGTSTTSGSVAAEFSPLPGADCSVEVLVKDDLGRGTNASEFLRVGRTDSPAEDPPSSSPATYAGIAVLLGMGLLFVLYAYRRFTKSPREPAPVEQSALPTVRQLMRQSQIIDRETFLLLCEEAGESPEAAQAALQELIRTGEVSTEPGPASDEVLRWKGVGTPDMAREHSP